MISISLFGKEIVQEIGQNSEGMISIINANKWRLLGKIYRSSTWYGFGLLLFACGDKDPVAPETTAIRDRIELSDPQIANEVGLLVDGFIEAGTGSLMATAVNDRREQVAAPDFNLSGNFTRHTRNELIAFHASSAPTLVENISWTEGEDVIAVERNEIIEFSITVWVLAAPFDELRQRVEDHVIIVNNIYSNERAGLRISDVEIIDVTSTMETDQFLNYSCDFEQLPQLYEAIGFKENTLNVYYVDRVEVGASLATGNGYFCSNIVAMGRTSSGPLLAHEFGHAFSLWHVDHLTNHFDDTNVMHSRSDVRRYFSEGQTFKQHHSPDSYLNLAGLRPGMVTRTCPESETATPACPAIQKRLWNDGSFQPN